MKKTKDLAVVLAAAVAICFALVSLLQSAPPEGKGKGEETKPIWDITEANWIDHAPNTRFAIYDPNGDSDPADDSTWTDDVVLDKETQLIWERVPVYATRTWLGSCSNKRLADRMGWRLPTQEEFGSITDYTNWDDLYGVKGLATNHPFAGIYGWFWSSTTNVDDTTMAWAVDAVRGELHWGVEKSSALYAWCVRGGQGDGGL